MNVLVLGGAGFIGSHLCDALLIENNRVICVDNFSLGTKDNIRHLLGNSQFVLYEKNIAEEDALNNIFEIEKPEYIFHLVANSDIQASASDPNVEYRNTYTTTYMILEAMRKYNVKKIFFSSTSAVYGDKRNELLDENTPNLSPVSYYGAAKLGSEALISAYSYMNDISALIFRFPNVIGPRLTHGVIYDFIRKLSDNPQRLEILGDGRQTKPYIYIDDLVNAILMLKNNNTCGVSLYNVGVNGATSVKRIADIICEEMHLQNVEYCYSGGETGWKGDVPRFQYCVGKIHSAGWNARFSSDEAVREAVRQNLKRMT